MLAAVGNVKPVGGGAVLVFIVLHDALVEGEIRDDPFHPASALGDGWDVEVGCFAGHVLAIGCSSDFWMIVELRTTVAGGDEDPLRFPLFRGKVIIEMLT